MRGDIYFSSKFVQLNIFDNTYQCFGHPFIFMVDELLPDIYLHIANVKVTKLSRFDGFAGYKIGQKGDHIAFRYDMRNDRNAWKSSPS